jgi:hypothetical protein
MAGTHKNSDYSPNATIITTGSGSGAPRPRNIINAISEIQQFYVIESQGQEIPAEFLTLEGSLDFFRIGATSGFKEGLFLILLFPVFSFYLLPFVLKSPDVFTEVIIHSVPYLPVLINTLLCSYISRYYVGNITRKAINSLFVGRASLLIVKSFFIYVFYYMLSALSTPERVWAVAQHFGANAEKFYYGYLEMLPHIVPVAVHCSIFILIAAVFPYGSVYMLDIWRRYKIRKNQHMIGN